MAQTGIANTATIRATVGMSPIPDLNAKLYIWYITVPEDNQALAGAAWPGGVSRDDDAGWEVDLTADYKLGRNLTYFVEAGILFAGDFYKHLTGTDDPDDAYLVRHGVTLSF